MDNDTRREHAAANEDRTAIAVQLGRPPRGEVEVVVRCEHGLPSVVRTSPRLETGEPFPTLFYLTCPMAIRAIGTLEADGTMREYEERLTADAELRGGYADAHDRYKRARNSIEDIGTDATAGGMPDRVKCLHALYAHELADSNPIGRLARDAIEPLGCPGPCVRDGVAVEGHPAFAGKKKRR